MLLLPLTSLNFYIDYQFGAEGKKLIDMYLGGCKDGDLRISEGTPVAGFLEYCLNDMFGIVCGDSFDNNDARVACKQLGYGANG